METSAAVSSGGTASQSLLQDSSSLLFPSNLQSSSFLSSFSLGHGFLVMFIISFLIFYFQIFSPKKSKHLSNLSVHPSLSTESIISSVLQSIPAVPPPTDEQFSTQESQELKLEKLIHEEQQFLKQISSAEPTFPLRSYPFDGPSARTGAAMCFDPDSGILAICGGMYENKFCRDFHLYVTPLDKWIQVTDDTGEGCLYANLLCFNGRICSYGGLKSKQEFSTEVRGFDFDKNKWEDLVCVTDQQPPPRFNATLTAVGPNHWVLFGGRGQDGVLYDDLWYLEITEDSEVMWEQIELSDNVSFLTDSEQFHSKRKSVRNPRTQRTQSMTTPLAREGHSMVCLDDRLVLIGGHTDSKTLSIPNGCVEVFNLETNQWSQVPTNGQGPEPSCMVGGAAHRIGETMKILVIGGSPGGTVPGVPVTESLCSDLFCPVYLLDFSVTPHQWTTLPIQWKGPDLTMPPESRCFFSSCFDSASMCLYLHGGINLHGTEQTGLCFLDCHGLRQESPESEEAEAEGEGEEGVGEGEAQPVQYADSHFYRDFLELIKPASREELEAERRSRQREITSVAPLPM
jgi:hypothetical protein